MSWADGVGRGLGCGPPMTPLPLPGSPPAFLDRLDRRTTEVQGRVGGGRYTIPLWKDLPGNGRFWKEPFNCKLFFSSGLLGDVCLGLLGVHWSIPPFLLLFVFGSLVVCKS